MYDKDVMLKNNSLSGITDLPSTNNPAANYKHQCYCIILIFEFFYSTAEVVLDDWRIVFSLYKSFNLYIFNDDQKCKVCTGLCILPDTIKVSHLSKSFLKSFSEITPYLILY